MNGMLELIEDDDFYFDAEAADRAVNFIEKYCIHFKGPHAGKAFILHPLQKRIVCDLIGWKWRTGDRIGQRRFTDCYWEGAIGCGKSPVLAAIGLYGLFMDREPAAEVYSLASTYGQAKIVFEFGKKFVSSNTALSRRMTTVERQIRHDASRSKWDIVSGAGPGAGCNPSLILADEVHDWKKATAYADLRDRMYKRSNPLLIAATNAGKTQASFCWMLRKKAVAALEGTGPTSLYPVIWKADDDAKTDDPAAWRAANPLIGTTLTEGNVRQIITEAMRSQEDETDARRLYLGIWPKAGAETWLDMNAWDACERTVNPPKGAPLYIGLDMAQCDDLCAVVLVWATPDHAYMTAHFWIPKKTAKMYTDKDGIPYDEWAAAGDITLVDEDTISSRARRDIAERVITLGKSQNIVGVYYDQHEADETVAIIEAAGVPCIPVSQGFSTSMGCYELDRRLKERAVTIIPNAVFRFCAENAQIDRNTYDSIRVVKPNAKGRYAGTRARKVDGITGAVTALTEARKHSFPAATRYWKGKIHA